MASSSQVSLDRRLTAGPISYHVTAAGDGEAPIDLVLARRDRDGRVLSSLTGESRPADLADVTDLITSTLAGLVAVRQQARVRRRPGNHGLRWSAEDDERLVERHRSGTPERELMAEFNRSRGGIRSRLEH